MPRHQLDGAYDMQDTIQPSGASNLLIGIEELAAALGRTPDYLKRNWRRMHTTLSMPPKHPSGWVWPRTLIDAWIMCPPVINADLANDNRPGDPDPEIHQQLVKDENNALRALYGRSH